MPYYSRNVPFTQEVCQRHAVSATPWTSGWGGQPTSGVFPGEFDAAPLADCSILQRDLSLGDDEAAVGARAPRLREQLPLQARLVDDPPPALYRKASGGGGVTPPPPSTHGVSGIPVQPCPALPAGQRRVEAVHCGAACTPRWGREGRGMGG